MCNFKAFVEHVREWKKQSIPYGYSDLVRLARKYDTPIIPRDLCKSD